MRSKNNMVAVFTNPKAANPDAIKQILAAFNSYKRPSSYAHPKKIFDFFYKIKDWHGIFGFVMPATSIDLSFWRSERVYLRDFRHPDGVLRSKTPFQYVRAKAPLLDLVVTLCDCSGDLKKTIAICRSRYLAGAYQRKIKWDAASLA